MRKPLVLSLVLSSASITSIAAAQKPCGLMGFESGCFVDDVLVIKGEEMGLAGPIATCDQVFVDGENKDDCYLGLKKDYLQQAPVEAAALKAIELAGVTGKQWDEVVVFTADFGPNKDGKNHGPLFYRTPGAGGAGALVNEVGGLGLPVVPRDPTKPYVGVIAGGTSKQVAGDSDSAFGKVFGPGANGNFNRVCDEGAAASNCFKDIFTYYDALAQATGSIYAPHLPPKTPAMGDTTVYPNMVYPAFGKTVLVNAPMGTAPPTAKIPGVNVNLWNGLLSTNGSLFGGNTFRNKGNGTWEVARPPAFQGVSAPFEGSQVLRFVPIDLYLMGFIPQKDVPALDSFANLEGGHIYLPAGTVSFNKDVGPGMGIRISGVAMRTQKPVSLGLGDQLTQGARNPEQGNDGGGMAPQAIRQLWVVVTKPPTKQIADGSMKAADWAKQKTEIENVTKGRRFFQHYFYNLTSYRGRVHTNIDGVDDSGYLEFGDVLDDSKEIAGVGADVRVALDGVPNSGGKVLSIMHITPKGTGAAGFSYNAAARPIKISGASQPFLNNLLTARILVPSNPGGKRLFANVSFDCAGGRREVRVPADGGLIQDGKFHNYSANIQDGAGNIKGATCTGLSFTIDMEGKEGNEGPPAAQLDYIKVTNTSADNLKDDDKACGGDVQGDGWLKVEDNCPNLPNPEQADGDGNGVGDDCEDFDGDNVPNLCDNCPTVTNSSQRDVGGTKGVGDACDGSQAESCFFSGATVAGTSSSPTSAGFWVGLGAFGLMVGNALRRRRRRG